MGTTDLTKKSTWHSAFPSIFPKRLLINDPQFLVVLDATFLIVWPLDHSIDLL
jgi:hypothetical protein